MIVNRCIKSYFAKNITYLGAKIAKIIDIYKFLLRFVSLYIKKTHMRVHMRSFLLEKSA
jgi:hypothetical protein